MNTNSDKSDYLPHLALLVVDVQAPFLEGLPAYEPFLSRVEFVVKACSILGIRTIFTEQVPEKLGHTWPALQAMNVEALVFAKEGFSALSSASLREYLEEQEVQHLLLVGLETPICIYQTVLEAVASDFDCTVLSDAVAAHREDDARIILDTIDDSSSHVLPSETIFYSILGGAYHPKFKEFSALVKAYR